MTRDELHCHENLFIQKLEGGAQLLDTEATETMTGLE